MLDLLRCGDYQFLDRYASGLSGEQIAEIYRKSFFADAFLCSTNAVTESGELYNVDGNGNRVAAMTFGPASVILVVGANKIVRDLAEAEQRVKEFAAPANCKRLACKTPCAVTGKCADCSGDGRICCTAVVHRQQRIPAESRSYWSRNHLATDRLKSFTAQIITKKSGGQSPRSLFSAKPRTAVCSQVKTRLST